MLLGGVNMIVYAVISVLSFWTVKSLGRRKLFFISSFGQMISMVITFGCLILGTATGSWRPSAVHKENFSRGIIIAYVNLFPEHLCVQNLNIRPVIRRVPCTADRLMGA